MSWKINEYTYHFVGESKHFYFQTWKVSCENDDRKIVIINFKTKNNIDENSTFKIALYFNDVEHFNSKTDSKEQFEKITIRELAKH